MRDLRALYQQIILEHNRSPRNFKKLDDPTNHAEGFNPLCGDRIEVYVQLASDVIQDIGFQGSGCAISQATASLMTSAVKGKTTDEAERLFRAFHEMVTASGPYEPDTDTLGRLAALGGVRQFPMRVKCANLPWHTLHAALVGEQQPVTTE